MHRFHRTFCWLVVLVALGCGASRSERVPVDGNVTFDGVPVETGQIVFEPKGPGRMSIGQIAAGRYSIAEKYGPTRGEFVVRITADRPSGEKAAPSSYAADQTPQDVYEQFVPAKYNSASELTLTIGDESHIKSDFTLTSS
jgi:hypothetical protein